PARPVFDQLLDPLRIVQLTDQMLGVAHLLLSRLSFTRVLPDVQDWFSLGRHCATLLSTPGTATHLATSPSLPRPWRPPPASGPIGPAPGAALVNRRPIPPRPPAPGPTAPARAQRSGQP